MASETVLTPSCGKDLGVLVRTREAMERACQLNYQASYQHLKDFQSRAWAVLYLGGGLGNGLELLKGFFPKEMVLVWGLVGDQKTAGALCTHSGEIVFIYLYSFL